MAQEGPNNVTSRCDVKLRQSHVKEPRGQRQGEAYIHYIQPMKRLELNSSSQQEFRIFKEVWGILYSMSPTTELQSFINGKMLPRDLEGMCGCTQVPSEGKNWNINNSSLVSFLYSHFPRPV